MSDIDGRPVPSSSEWDAPATSGWEEGPSALFDALESSLRRGDVSCALVLTQSIRCRLERRKPKPHRRVPRLTDREQAVLVLLLDGSLSQKGMAQAMDISHNTLKTHLRSLYQKLGAHSRAEAIEHGLAIETESFWGRSQISA
ncbi:MAG: LuxR C-terminal-related transcriptional regulator [Acidimicrobiia bacterium]|nr:LuxR C-terminal-related transcriptional regulator [Acidimicrobiia bacterium]